MIDVGRLAPGNQWDQTILDALFANRLYPTGLEFRVWSGYPPRTDGCILIVPGRYWVGHEAEISTAIARYTWVLAFRTSDEEDRFDIAKVRHPNLRWWVQTPRVGRGYGGARLFGVGFPPHFNHLPAEPPEKRLNVFLAAQNTHIRREQCFAALEGLRYTVAYPTSGFTQGVEPSRYVSNMLAAKVAPAPSGAVSPDSFRAFEALESHAVPIADAVSPVDGLTDYWRRLFPDAPFPVIEDYRAMGSVITDVLSDWPRSANVVAAWWIRQKRTMASNLLSDLESLGAL